MNGIEKELDGKANVIRVNMFSKIGREISKRYDVSAARTLIVLDSKGKEVYRNTGLPKKEAVLAAVNGSNSN